MSATAEIERQEKLARWRRGRTPAVQPPKEVRPEIVGGRVRKRPSTRATRGPAAAATLSPTIPDEQLREMCLGIMRACVAEAPERTARYEAARRHVEEHQAELEMAKRYAEAVLDGKLQA